MKLDRNTQNQLVKIIINANSIGIRSLIIEDGFIRGTGESLALILLDDNPLDMSELGSIGINRLPLFKSRIELLDDAQLTIMPIIKEEDNGDKVVESFTLKDKKTSIGFKCCRTSQIKAPRALKSTIIYTFDITEDSLVTMMHANNAMKNDTMSFSFQDGTVNFKLSDESGDILNHTLSEKINIMEDDAPASFFFNYDKKILLPLIKLAFKSEQDTLTLSFTKRGMVNLVINSLNIYVAAEL